MGSGQDHRRRPRAAARAGLQRLSRRDPPSPDIAENRRRVEVDPERLAGWVERFAARHGALGTSPVEGGVSIAAPDGAVASLFPPWPVGPLAPRSRENPAGTGAEADPLEQLIAAVQRPRVVGLLLVRRGGFAVGVAEGAELVDSKVGQRHVQGTTKAGGWSQQRFARRRDNQARAAFSAAADHAARVLLRQPRRLDGLVTGGDRAAVAAVLTDPRLRALDDLPQGRFLAVPDPRRRVLEDAVRRCRTVAIDVYDPLRDEA